MRLAQKQEKIKFRAEKDEAHPKTTKNQIKSPNKVLHNDTNVYTYSGQEAR